MIVAAEEFYDPRHFGHCRAARPCPSSREARPAKLCQTEPPVPADVVRFFTWVSCPGVIFKMRRLFRVK